MNKYVFEYTNELKSSALVQAENDKYKTACDLLAAKFEIIFYLLEANHVEAYESVLKRLNLAE